MRIAAIYDIHGNLPALEAVLDDIERESVDQLVVGGDVVLGPMPRETLGRLLDLDLPTQFISGNCEREVVATLNGAPSSGLPQAVRETMSWVAEEVGPAVGNILASWPETVRVRMPELGDVLFCHATPRNDYEIITQLTSDDRLSSVLQGVDAPLIVCGHTHMQFDRTVGKTRIVNAGSVGMPFGEPGAYWLLLEADVQLRRTDFDRIDAAEQVRLTKYPQAEEFAKNVIRPPTAEAMLEVFARAERS
jgi:putative phosphoesterase